MCHPHTRRALVDEIMTFITCRVDQEQSNIFLLRGVAGLGKTALAHTIARQCTGSDPPMLIATFFFDREVNLSATDRMVAVAIVDAIDHDRSIVSASLDHQFEELVLKSSELLSGKGALAFIIDALDESADEDFLKVVARFSELPRSISIIVTCRDTPGSLNTLDLTGNCTKVRRNNLQDAENIADVTAFAEDRLQEVVAYRKSTSAMMVLRSPLSAKAMEGLLSLGSASIKSLNTAN